MSGVCFNRSDISLEHTRNVKKEPAVQRCTAGNLYGRVINIYTNKDLNTMQSWPLERKIRVTQTKIIEWYLHYKGKVAVAFSGGVDSTV